MVTVEVGSFLVGIAGILTAIGAMVSARRARGVADAAMRTSPAAHFEGLREQIKAMQDAHDTSMSRHAVEREGMEGSLMMQRERAEQAETKAFHLQGQVAELSVGLVEANHKLKDLEARFEAFTRSHP